MILTIGNEKNFPHFSTDGRCPVGAGHDDNVIPDLIGDLHLVSFL